MFTNRKWLFIVIPSIFKEQTRGMPSIRLHVGNWIWRCRMLSTKTISDDFLRLRLRLLAHDHDRMFSISRVLESTLEAGMTRQVSSAYLQKTFPRVNWVRSPALTTWQVLRQSFEQCLQIYSGKLKYDLETQCSVNGLKSNLQASCRQCLVCRDCIWQNRALNQKKR